MTFLGPFLTALIISLVLTPIVRIFALKFGFIDDPKSHKHPAILHRTPIARAGGLAIYLAVAIAAIAAIPMTKELMGILAGGMILVAAGLIDDKVDQKSYVMLLFQFLAVLVAVGSGIGVPFITNPLLIFGSAASVGGEVIRLDTFKLTLEFLGGVHSILILADIFAIFWIVWVINMVNFSSGVDGQMPGIVVISLLVISLASMRFLPGDPSQIMVIKLALIGAGATLGFLFFNFYPAKIFPGDSGSYFLGFLVAVCAVISGAKVGTAMLVMAVPLTDGVFTIIRRTASGRSPFTGDRKHLHHLLMDMGWSQRKIALFYYILCAILGAIALSLHSTEKLFAAAVVMVIVLGGLLWLNMNLSQKLQK